MLVEENKSNENVAIEMNLPNNASSKHNNKIMMIYCSCNLNGKCFIDYYVRYLVVFVYDLNFRKLSRQSILVIRCYYIMQNL